jgi:hypothetical protein
VVTVERERPLQFLVHYLKHQLMEHQDQHQEDILQVVAQEEEVFPLLLVVQEQEALAVVAAVQLMEPLILEVVAVQTELALVVAVDQE